MKGKNLQRYLAHPLVQCGSCGVIVAAVSAGIAAWHKCDTLMALCIIASILGGCVVGHGMARVDYGR